MTKSDLVGQMAKDGGITRAQAQKALGSFVSAITTSLSAGEKVTLPGFGTFSVGERAPREGRNPKTGERINIQASKVVKFRAGKSVRERVK